MSETESKYASKKKSAWEQYTDEQLSHCYALAQEYKTFLNEVKTEREAVNKIRNQANEVGKQYFINKDKEIALVTKGSKPLSEGGVNVGGALPIV